MRQKSHWPSPNELCFRCRMQAHKQRSEKARIYIKKQQELAKEPEPVKPKEITALEILALQTEISKFPNKKKYDTI